MKAIFQQLTETIANEAMFGIAAFDKDGKSFYMNKMAEQLLACHSLEIHQLKPLPEQVRAQILPFSTEILKHDGLYQDILLNRPNGQALIANIGVKLTSVDSQDVMILMFQDVTFQKKLQREITAKQTEIKAAYEELLKQNRQLTELDKAKNRFIAITTHELRTPLAAMVASAEILKLGLYDDAAQMKEFVNIIYDQGQQLSDLVNDILDFAKIQAGKMDFYIEQQDVVPYLTNIMRNFGDMASANSVTIEYSPPDTPILCYFDEVRLRQVLSNIVNNGIKYNKPGGKLTVAIEKREDKIRVSFRDTGKGIPADQFDKVFNEFETIGNVAQHHKGTGLGMPISRKLIQGMGGTLDFDSEFGVGSTFWAEIPLTKLMPDDLYRPRPEKTGDLAS